MIDLSNLKAPGWQRVVAELNAPAADDRTFLVRLVTILAQVAGARQAALFAVDAASEGESGPGAEPRPVFIWPTAEGVEPALESAPEQRSAARAAVESGQVRAFGLDKEETFYDGSPAQGCVIALPLQGAGPAGGQSGDAGPVGARGVITLLTESRSRAALQTTMAMVELVAGYTHAHAARLQLRRSRTAGAALDLAGRLIAAINGAATFRGAAMQLSNDLSRQIKADRVALGWVRGIGESGAVRVVAMSDTELVDRRMAMVQKIEAAMDECLDQEQAVVFPPPPQKGEGGDVLLSQSITHAHRELCAADARLKVASLPLREGETVVGVVTIESASDAPIDVATLELVQAALDLVAPVLKLRRSDDRNLAQRAWASTIRSSAWLVGTRHTAWKLAGLALLVASIAVTVIRVPYRVEAPVELQPRQRRVVAVPFEGVIASLGPGIEPGATVAAGDVLAEMDASEWKLSELDALGQLIQAEKRADAARKVGKLSEAQQADAQAAQARARLDLARMRLEQAHIRAPIAGRIIAGDIKDKIGAAVKLGEPLFQVADLQDMIVVARVDDRDIKLIVDQGAAGQAGGEVATKAYPAAAFPFQVDSVVPLAEARDGRNAFEVRGTLKGSAGWMRPGMEGIAKFDVGRRTLLDIGTRRIRDTLRLWLWW